MTPVSIGGSSRRWRSLGAAILGAVLATGVQADVPAARADADRFRIKLNAITVFSSVPARRSQRIDVTEREVNAYLALDMSRQLPAGVIEPSLTILGDGRASGRAVVDLDRVRAQVAGRSAVNPLQYLSGRLPVGATGILIARQGVGRFELEAATIAGVRVPTVVLQEIVSHYSRTPENPTGIRLDAPFILPAGIREIQTSPGRAVVIQ